MPFPWPVLTQDDRLAGHRRHHGRAGRADRPAPSRPGSTPGEPGLGCRRGSGTKSGGIPALSRNGRAAPLGGLRVRPSPDRANHVNPRGLGLVRRSAVGCSTRQIAPGAPMSDRAEPADAVGASPGCTLVARAAPGRASRRWPSAWPARLAEPVTYVATAAVDPDDADHRGPHRRPPRPPARRLGDGRGPRPDRPRPACSPPSTGPVLLDSLGTWVAGHPDLAVDAAARCAAALRARPWPTVVVSEEVGLVVHPPTAVGRRFVDALGECNQAVAARRRHGAAGRRRPGPGAAAGRRGGRRC